MSATPVFSVVIPTYNRASSIEAAIESALNQTFDLLEVIVVDDGSKDDTEGVVRAISDKRVRYIRQENGGAPKARNRGVDEAVGKYIAFLDSDDKFLPQHLNQAHPILERNEFVCTYTQVVVDRGSGVSFLKPHRALGANEAISDYLLRDRGFVQTSSLIVPKHVAQNVRYDEELPSGQDTDLAIRLVAHGAQLVMLESPGAVWVDYPSQNRVSSKGKAIQRELWLERVREKLTHKAYLADLGWPVAKIWAREGCHLKAGRYYFNALVSGCYRPKMALVVFLQVFMPPSLYRNMSDILAKFGFKP